MMSDLIPLYPDQEEFVTEIRKLWKSNSRILGMAPTGFGKTRVAARIIQGCTNADWRVCFLVPRISLIDQTVKSFNDLGLHDITVMWGPLEVDRHAKITIASIDTYIRRDKMDFDLVIHDEVHKKRKKLLEWMTEFPEDRYLALTATPYASFLGHYYSGFAKAKSMSWLMENNRLSQYDVYSVGEPDLSNVDTGMTVMGRDFREAQLEKIMGEDVVLGNIVQNWLENGENRLTMVLAVNKLHAGKITNEFNKYNVATELIVAETPVEERLAIFERARCGITKIISSVNCLNEGFDLPECTCLINARPTKSEARFQQGIGRVLRWMEGKRALIFDHSGDFIRLGFPEDIDIDKLPNSSDGMQDESSIFTEVPIEKKPKKCTNCSYLKPVGMHVCVRCGHKPIAGQDVAVNEDAKLTQIGKDGKKKEKTYTMEEKQSFYSELFGFRLERAAKGKMYSESWCNNTYKNKYGVWPNKLKKAPKTPTPATRSYIKHLLIKFAKSKKKK